MSFAQQRDDYHNTDSKLLRSNEPPTGTCTLKVTTTMAGVLEGTLPIVIPQTSRALRGVYYSPFLRAYPEVLYAHGISKEDFIRLIDDLNESFISSPFFYGIMVAGTAVSFVPEVAAQVVGGVVAAASSVASTANSHMRTKLFLKAANQDVFEPRGLQIRLLGTKDMLKAINVDEEEFKLPPLPEFNKPDLWQEHEDPRQRWVQALENVVAPLNYDAPEYCKQESWLKKAGVWTAKVQDQKQTKSLMKRREKARNKIVAARDEASQNEEKIQQRIYELRNELCALSSQISDDPKIEVRRQADVAKCEQAINRQQAKLINEKAKKDQIAEAAIAKVDKKEHRLVQKIRWVVITPGNSSEIVDEDMDDGMEEVHPLKSQASSQVRYE